MLFNIVHLRSSVTPLPSSLSDHQTWPLRVCISQHAPVSLLGISEKLIACTWCRSNSLYVHSVSAKRYSPGQHCQVVLSVWSFWGFWLPLFLVLTLIIVVSSDVTVCWCFGPLVCLTLICLVFCILYVFGTLNKPTCFHVCPLPPALTNKIKKNKNLIHHNNLWNQFYMRC